MNIVAPVYPQLQRRASRRHLTSNKPLHVHDHARTSSPDAQLPLQFLIASTKTPKTHLSNRKQTTPTHSNREKTQKCGKPRSVVGEGALDPPAFRPRTFKESGKSRSAFALPGNPDPTRDSKTSRNRLNPQKTNTRPHLYPGTMANLKGERSSKLADQNLMHMNRRKPLRESLHPRQGMIEGQVLLGSVEILLRIPQGQNLDFNRVGCLRMHHNQTAKPNLLLQLRHQGLHRSRKLRQLAGENPKVSNSRVHRNLPHKPRGSTEAQSLARTAEVKKSRNATPRTVALVYPELQRRASRRHPASSLSKLILESATHRSAGVSPASYDLSDPIDPRTAAERSPGTKFSIRQESMPVPRPLLVRCRRDASATIGATCLYPTTNIRFRHPTPPTPNSLWREPSR